MLNSLKALVKDIIPNVDWRGMMVQSEVIQKLMTKQETWVLVNAAIAMREPLAKALLETGEITEEEAGPVKEGGLGLVELVKRAVDKDKEEGDNEDSG